VQKVVNKSSYAGMSSVTFCTILRECMPEIVSSTFFLFLKNEAEYISESCSTSPTISNNRHPKQLRTTKVLELKQHFE